MRYVPGVADEGTKGVKPKDEFEAVETIPEGRMYSPDDYQVELGENAVSEVKDLYSDVSELQKLGGDKTLINDISVTLQKKKVLKKIEERMREIMKQNQPISREEHNNESLREIFIDNQFKMEIIDEKIENSLSIKD